MTSLDSSATSLPRRVEYARTNNGLPKRALPKNKTGAFVEAQNGPQSYRTIPPLARSRAVPGPGYTTGHTRQNSQKQVVQNIRARQDWKGGFFPQPVKRNKSKQLHDRLDYRPSPHLLNGLPGYRDLTKRSARNYVAAANNGVTHLEDLRSQSSTSIKGDCTCDLTSDLDSCSLKKLEEVCKKIEMEESLTPSPRLSMKRAKSGRKRSPLLIRSFRNPQNPHPVVQYTDISEAHSAGKDYYVARPPVPAPYFYSSRTLPRASDTGGSRVHLSRLSGARSSEHILAAPGVGFLTKAPLGLTGDKSLADGVKGQPPPGIRAMPVDSDEQERFRVPSTTPATSIPDLPKRMQDSEATEVRDHVSLPDCNGDEVDEDDQSIAKLAGEMALGPNGPSIPIKITLSLETADGVNRAINLEEEEERNRRDVLEYHAAEKALGMTDSPSQPPGEGASVIDENEGELTRLLSEHSQIVSQINDLQQRATSDDETNPV